MYTSDTLALAKDKPIPFNHEVFAKAAKRLFDEGKFTVDLLATDEGRGLIEETYNVLNGAISFSIQEETPSELTAALRNNVFVFSGFKSYHQLREASSLLTREDGSVRSFSEFESEVKRVDEKYNTQYLYAEYNHAVHSAQMASKWHEWEKDGDEYNLQYRTAGDERVREAHAALEGVTLPPSDKFWEQYLPPNGWNCRCQVVQVLRDDYPMSDSERATEWGDNCTSDKKAQIFRYNAGKELKVFPPKHPYLPKGCGDCPKKSNTLLLTKSDRPLPQCKVCGEIFNQCLKRQYEEIRSWSKKNIPEKIGWQIKGENLATGSIKITRSAIKGVLGHTLNMAVRNSMYGIQTGILKYKYVGWKETDKGKHSDAAFFTYYEVEIAGHKYYANVIASKAYQSEVLYCIYEKCDLDSLRHDELPKIE